MLTIICLEDAQDVLLSLNGQFVNSKCTTGSGGLTISDASSPSVIGTEPPPVVIQDNILWDTAATRINMPVMLNVNITGCNDAPPGSLALYYALITPTPTMALDSQLLFVNYTDTTIVYEGQWLNSTMEELITSKISTTVGDIMKFPFTGLHLLQLSSFTMDSTTHRMERNSSWAFKPRISRRWHHPGGLSR